MINITIGSDGAPSESIISLGNKFENMDETIQFSFPDEFSEFNKYLIAIMRVNNVKRTIVLPVIDNQVVVSTQLTQNAGTWIMYAMLRQKSTIDLSGNTVDLSAKDNEHIFISDGFSGRVFDSEIDRASFENLPLDANLRSVYDDLVNLKKELEEKINSPVSYTNLTDVPSEFPPASHNHDNLYYKKTEVNDMLSNKLVNATYDNGTLYLTGKGGTE